MRIIHLPGTFRPDRCGVSHYTARLTAELAKRGLECLVATSQQAAKAADRPGVVGVTRAWDARLLLEAPRAIVHLDPDLVHIQHAAGSYGFRRAVLWLLPALRLAGWRGPVVVTAHEYGWWEWRPRLAGWAWRRLGPWGEARALWDREDLALLTGADAVIVTNEAAARALTARMPRVTPRVVRVPIGSNIPLLEGAADAARAALRADSGWPSEAPIIAYFGFLHPVKGLETLLAAFHRLQQARPLARLLLMGGAESLALPGDQARQYEARLRGEVHRLGLEGAVRLTGYLPEEVLSRYLAGCDLAVLPFHAGVTLKSGSLLALWEHGLPVIATRAPMVEPEVEEGAWLAPCRDAGALDAAMACLLDRPTLAQALAARGRRVAAGFSWPAIAAQHLELYRRLLSNRLGLRPEDAATPPAPTGAPSAPAAAAPTPPAPAGAPSAPAAAAPMPPPTTKGGGCPDNRPPDAQQSPPSPPDSSALSALSAVNGPVLTRGGEPAPAGAPSSPAAAAPTPPPTTKGGGCPDNRPPDAQQSPPSPPDSSALSALSAVNGPVLTRGGEQHTHGGSAVSGPVLTRGGEQRTHGGSAVSGPERSGHG